MNQPTRLFERELNFTNAYRKHINDDKAIREYACLKEQLVQSFRAVKEGDLFVGRKELAMVTFIPLRMANQHDNMAYVMDFAQAEEVLEQIKASGEYDADYIKDVEEAIAFWKVENTVTKTRNAFTEEMTKSLAGDNYLEETAACYPLYRMAGVNLNFKKLLHYGLSGLVELIQEQATKTDVPEKQAFYTGLIGSLELIKDGCEMYRVEVEKMIESCTDEVRLEELKLMATSLKNIQVQPPQTLHESLQLMTIYMISCYATEIGRMDDYLCLMYEKDVKENGLTRETAIKYINQFFNIIEEELERDTRVIVGGYGRENGTKADEFGLVILDVLAQRIHHILPQVSLRYYKDMDQRLFDKSLEILGMGCTFPIMYNDDVNVKSVMHAMGVSQEVAEQYSFFGCGEYMLIAKSIGTPNILLNMPKVLELALHNGQDPVSGVSYGIETGELTDETSFEELMANYKKQAEYFVDLSGSFQELTYDTCNAECSFLLISLLQDNCIESGKAMLDGGFEHLGGTLETYGNITTSDSLAAIKEIVYDRQLMTLSKLKEVLAANFEGYEEEKQMLLDAQKFGNDYDGVDAITVEVHEHICNAIRDQRLRTRLDSFLVVMINNNTNTILGSGVGATPDGRCAKEFISNGNTAYNGRDKEGITALMKSMVKLDTKIHAGATHNFKFSVDLFNNNREKTKSLLKAYFALGGQQTNLTVVNQKDLEDALIHPENHANLMVRVGGFTARFVELDHPTQKEIIKRTAY